MTAPYWSGNGITLYLGDCREVTDWLAADILVTDPPYGRGWKQGDTETGRGWSDNRHGGIAGDGDTGLRDWALSAWGDRLAIAFGDLMLAPPIGTKQVLPYEKAVGSGVRGATAGFRRDAEAVYLIGPWPSGLGGRGSVLRTGVPMHAGPGGLSARYGHPHAKPIDVMETLIAACPSGTVADPFAGSGSTLMAARNLGRRAVGVELEERYAERAARRLDQGILDLTGA
jgi:site-specific DNA-methyltransferase (adenine-specific)